MKLQKQLSRKVSDKEYVKWVITIPPHTIKELGWAEGQALLERIENGKLVLASDEREKREKENV